MHGIFTAAESLGSMD